MEDSSLTVSPYARVTEMVKFGNLSYQILSSTESFLDSQFVSKAHAVKSGKQKIE